MASQREFAVLFNEFCAARGVPISKNVGAVGMWYQALGHLSAEDLRSGFVTVLQTVTEFPTPAHVLRVVGADPQQFALKMWAFVLSAVRSHGRDAAVNFGHRANVAVRAVGGWQAICDASPRDLDFKKREFVDAFICAREDDDGSFLNQAPGREQVDFNRESICLTDRYRIANGS